MFNELKALLEKDKVRTQQSIGRTVDCLKKIAHFKKLDRNLGSDYLIALISSLQPFVLREGTNLINENFHYVLVEGDLRVQFKLGGERAYQIGKLIDLRDNPHFNFVASSDCHMLKILHDLSSHSHEQKKLSQMERAHNKNFKEFHKLISLSQHQEKLQIIENKPFFSVLGQYDMCEFAIGSHIKKYSQSMSTHQPTETCNKIGYVVSGKVKLMFSNSQSAHNEKGISWFLNEGDWIGLEEFLWERPLTSSGQVYSIEAILIWIPCDLFSAKFNLKTNYEAISQLMSLIKTKKILFDRSYDCRKKKEREIQAQDNDTRGIKSQLLQKMTAFHSNQQKKKSHFRRTKYQGYMGQQQQKILMPDQILHRIKSIQQEPLNLPRLNDKINLFSQQFAKSPVSGFHKKQMHRLKQLMGKSKSTEYRTIELNPEALYKTIYDKIAFKFAPKTQARSVPRGYMHEDRSLPHYNCSIYNNFKVSRQRSESLKKSEGLTIYPFSD